MLLQIDKDCRRLTSTVNNVFDAGNLYALPGIHKNEYTHALVTHGYG